MRAAEGDTGLRPISGVFWESPDIFVLPGVAPQDAPAIPAHLGGVAEANASNTVYAQVWNLGQSPVSAARVDFYWFNPTLGFSEGTQNAIGSNFVAIEGNSRQIVKCPIAWRAQYLNGGHECLLVRVSATADPLGLAPWDASGNRHIGQRNIHVVSARGAGQKLTIGINVGPLFGEIAQVNVYRADRGAIPWLDLITTDRNKPIGNGTPNGEFGITPPIPTNTCFPDLSLIRELRPAGLIASRQVIGCDDQMVAFVAIDRDPGNGNVDVYRVVGSKDGKIFGGYSIVIVGSPSVSGEGRSCVR